MTCIRYKAGGYKYQLVEACQIQTNIRPPVGVATPWVALDIDGLMTFGAGYAWDGPSGPTIDTKSSMRGSLAHDGGYQLIRLGLLPAEFRDELDAELQRLCLEDGMWPARAQLWHDMVRLAAGPVADPSAEPQVQCAPGDCGRCPTEPVVNLSEIAAP